MFSDAGSVTGLFDDQIQIALGRDDAFNALVLVTRDDEEEIGIPPDTLVLDSGDRDPLVARQPVALAEDPEARFLSRKEDDPVLQLVVELAGRRLVVRE